MPAFNHRSQVYVCKKAISLDLKVRVLFIIRLREKTKTFLSLCYNLGANTGAKSRGLSTGALIGIIITVVLIIAIVIAVIVYKCRKTQYYRGDRLVDKPARFSDLKSRFGRTTEVPYQEDID